MFRSQQKYLDAPVGFVSRKLRKIKTKATAKIIYLTESINGAYCPKIIHPAWEPYKRMDIINNVIAQMGYASYLEIGCNKNYCFDNIRAARKIGVDPYSGGTLRMTSDQFFAENKEKFDCIFIDGLHLYEQVRKDIINALDCLKDNGTIMMHDCLPVNYWAQATAPVIDDWNGDTWKAFVEARTWNHVDSGVCVIDHGIGIIRKKPNARPLHLPDKDFKHLRFADFADHYQDWLNIVAYADVVNFIRMPSA